jgi:hypothetical protein
MRIAVSERDGVENRKLIQAALDKKGSVRLPPGRIPLTGGVVLHESDRLTGTGNTILAATESAAEPVLHVIGARAKIQDLSITLPTSVPGPHDGARFTAITIGDYLYPDRPTWINDVSIRRVRVRRPAQCPANSIAVVGAVRRLTLRDIDVEGGGTGVAVHWGAVATSVSDITGPSYHPHELTIDGLRVRNAFEGFYLSSVHDVDVHDFVCDNVEIGFRLLAGDNADTYHENPKTSQVSRRIVVRDGRIRWRGRYAIRVAGWGRSEVDRSVRRLPYRDVTVTACDLTAIEAAGSPDSRSRAAVVLEHGDGVRFADVAIAAGIDVPEATIDGHPVVLAELLSATVAARRR